MRTLISSLGNDFNKRFALSVETAKSEIKTYEAYRIEADNTVEMIARFRELHGEENVTVTESYEDWAGDLVVDITVKAKAWECIYESRSLMSVKAFEKKYKNRS